MTSISSFISGAMDIADNLYKEAGIVGSVIGDSSFGKNISSKMSPICNNSIVSGVWNQGKELYNKTLDLAESGVKKFTGGDEKSTSVRAARYAAPVVALVTLYMGSKYVFAKPSQSVPVSSDGFTDAGLRGAAVVSGPTTCFDLESATNAIRSQFSSRIASDKVYDLGSLGQIRVIGSKPLPAKEQTGRRRPGVVNNCFAVISEGTGLGDLSKLAELIPTGKRANRYVAHSDTPESSLVNIATIAASMLTKI
jgi:hypothetical protein